jgi:hypothetical protein
MSPLTQFLTVWLHFLQGKSNCNFKLTFTYIYSWEYLDYQRGTGGPFPPGHETDH